MIARMSWFLAGALICAGCSKGAAPKPPVMPTLPGMAAVAPPTITGNDPRANLFLTKGCPTCHSVTAVGIKSSTDVGPDLSIAYTDVHSRFGTSLEEFLPNPTGTMQMVLGQLIKLSPAERDSVIHILKQISEEHEHDAQEHKEHP
ncbi:MAG TPA: hypothetical protein VFP39_07545 [Gemmatimonadales bacterium]|nr:hypothetical protein [Gemmatimonadales bacterium]